MLIQLLEIFLTSIVLPQFAYTGRPWSLGLTDRFRVAEIRILMTSRTGGGLVTCFPGPLYLQFYSRTRGGEDIGLGLLVMCNHQCHFSLLPSQVVADLPMLQQVGPYCRPTREQHHYAPSQVHWSSPGHVLPRQEAAVYPTVHQVKSNKQWVPVYPSYVAQHSYSAAGSVISGDVNNSFGSDRCYSLFSEQQSPFGVSLLPSPRPPEGRSSAAVMATSTEPSSKFDEWPTF